MTVEELIASIETEAADAPTSEDVAALERTLETTLPPDYRRLLLATPGGELGSVVTFSMGTGRDFLARIPGLGGRGLCSIVGQMTEDRDEAVLPLGLLRIMDGRGGDAIAMAIRPDRIGEIFFVDHEVADPEEPAPTIEIAEDDDWGYAIPLAPNFTDFIAGLTVEDD